jgi:hypothetical protein
MPIEFWLDDLCQLVVAHMFGGSCEEREKIFPGTWLKASGQWADWCYLHGHNLDSPCGFVLCLVSCKQVFLHGREKMVMKTSQNSSLS